MKTKKTASILIRAFWLGVLMLALWANIFILWDDPIYAAHARWFALSYREFAHFMYGAMIFFKLVLILFFLLPYLGIKWAEYSRKNRN